MHPDRKRIAIQLAGIAVLTLALRLPFYRAAINGSDSIYYVLGGLATYVAHAPGYVGYCTLGMALDKLFGNILHAYLIVNLSCTLAAVLLVYPLARRMGFSARAGIISALIFSLSLCTLKFSLIVTTYMVEAMLANLIGVAGLSAIQRKSRGWALMTTVIWAAGGALRPSTTYLLSPLWAHTILKSDRRIATIVLHLIIAIPTVAAWSNANSYFLAAQNGFRTTPGALRGVEGQMMMGGNAESAGLDITVDLKQAPAGALAYHWPIAEIMHWVELKLGINIFPKSRPWPQPSLKHAFVQIATYIAKMGFFFVLSAPMIVLIPILWRLRKRLPALARDVKAFCAWWMIPPLLFFTLAHFGMFGYLSVFLAVPFVLIVGMLVDAPGSIESSLPSHLLKCVFAMFAVTTGIWLIGRPMQSQSRLASAANLLVLSHTGNATRNSYVISRATISGSSGDITDRFVGASTDAQLIERLRELNLFPNSVYKLPDRSR